jgi:ABC-type multidrug transport system ATPase subunit
VDVIHIDHIKGKITLDAKNLSKRIIEYTFPLQWESVRILNDISLSIKAGELVGIMGPSGAGKSTLLKMLSGIDKINGRFANGQIFYNDIDITQNPNYFKNLIAYLPQDDILFPDLTVYECLKYVAKLRMPHLSKENIENLIENVLISLDMADMKEDGTYVFPLINKKIGNVNKAGALSGGQRKRINLAVELLSNPSILFLDEPTSGLSSTGSDKLINLLVKISNVGNTVVTSIHQPSRKIFSKFNKILILTKNGKQAYFGSVQRSVDYFQRRSNIKYETTTNPAVYILEVLDSKTPEYWEKQYKESEAYVYYIQHQHKDLQIAKENGYEKIKKVIKERIPNFSQIMTLLSRNFKLKINNKMSLLLLILQAPIIALFVGLIFSGVIKDGSKLDKFKPEEEFFRLEHYSRPSTSRYLPPFSEDMKIKNLSSKPLWLYSQANDVVYADTNYYEKIGPYIVSKQILDADDHLYFPVKAGNYELVVSDSALDNAALRKAMKFSPDDKTNSNYYILKEGPKTFAVNDWNSLTDSQKVILWYDKVLSERRKKVEREKNQFEEYNLFDTSSVIKWLNYPFNRYYSLNQIKKYFYTVKTNKFDWFDATYDKSVIYTGSFGYKEQSEKLLYLLFILILSFIWIGMTNSVKDVVVERQIFIREHRYNLKITNYLASKFLALFFISILQITAFLWVLYQFIPVIPTDNTTIFLILLLTSMVAGGIGLFISSLASTIEFAIFSLPLILIPQIIFAGIFKHIGAMSELLRHISTWTISRWSLESMVNSIARRVDFESPFHHFFVPFNNIIYPCYYPTMEGSKIVQNGYFPYVLEIDILILILFVIITFCTSSLILFAKTKFIKK